MGYEEALGYSVGPAVRDKDGISAAVVFADMAASAKAAGQSVLDRLAALYADVGVWASAQHSVRFAGDFGPDQVGELLDNLVSSPPEELQGLPIVGVTDFREGAAERPRYLAATPLVELNFGEAGRCLIRPSGTEPKLKIYVDLAEPAGGTGTAELMAAEAALRLRAAEVAAEVAADMT